MNKLVLAAALTVAASTAFAGGIEPVQVMPEVVVVEETGSTAAGIVVPLLLLVLIAAAAAS